MSTFAVQARQCDVIVIGAGFAGLSAATAIARDRRVHPANLVVLEASHRVGGRAWSMPSSDDLALEMGATWLHGVGPPSDLNPILAEAVRAKEMSISPPLQQWWESEHVMPHRDSLLNKRERLTVHAAVRRYREALDTVVETTSGALGEVLEAAKESYLKGQGSALQDEDRRLFEDAWAWREKLQGVIDGYGSTREALAAGRGAYQEWAGDEESHAPVPCGFSRIVEAVARPLNVLTGHIVNLVKWNEEGVEVICANGARFVAPAAIVTVSLGVLKSRQDESGAVDNGDFSDGFLRERSSATAQVRFGFSPPLPKTLSKAIDNMRIGIVDKLFIVFHRDKEHEPGPQDMKSRDPKVEETSSDGSIGISYALLWGPEDNSENLPSWCRGIFSIRFGGPEMKRTKVPQEKTGADDIVAVLWMSGDDALAMESIEGNEEILEGIQAMFAHFPAMKLPSGARWENATLIRTTWGSDPLTRGSYSFVGDQGSLSDVETLSKGIELSQAIWGRPAPRTVVAFAGEACHLSHIGTVHGAWESGRRAAERILRDKYGENGD